MKILSIDPGYTSGICLADVSDNFKVIQVGEFKWSDRHDWLERLITGKYTHQGIPHTFDVVIIENFRLRPDKARTQIGKVFPSSQLIGIVDYLCYHNHIELVVQEPGVRTRVKILDEHADLIVGPHQHDAYQHARYFYVTEIRGREGLQKKA
jgi:hypothetical protein